MKSYWPNAFLALCVLALVTPVKAQIEDGVPARQPAAEAVSIQTLTFDPPCVFRDGIPLQLAPYLNPATNTTFVLGNGVVLTGCGGFNVTGISQPNFMAWNCQAANADGTVPALPEVWFFTNPVTTVSVRIGSASHAGENAALVALGPYPTFTPLDVKVVQLTSALQTITTTAAGTNAAALFGPCVMVADDFSAQ